MATQIIKTVFQFRRGTTAEWLANKTVVPAAGEPCFDIELNTLKIGDGVKIYEQLTPINGVQLKVENGSLVLEDNTLKLMGFKDAPEGSQPRKKADGTLEWIVPSTETVDGLQKVVTSLQSDVKSLQESDGTLLSKIGVLEQKMDGVGEGTVDDKIDAKINAWANEITENGTIDTVKEVIDYVSKHGSEVADMLAKIAELQTKVGEDTVQNQITTAIAGKVDKEEGKGLSSNDFTDSLLGKLEGIEDNAQVNVIEKVSIGGSILDIANKIVEIPVASLDHAGVVKSSTGANKVNISNSGEMSVNKVSVNSLFVPIGDELILDGGGAYKSAPVYPTRVGNIGYNSVSDAVNCADNGDVVTLQEDVNMGTGDNDNLVVNAENVTIDLGGKTFTASGSHGAIRVNGGMTTLSGAGTVNGTLGSDGYSMAIWVSEGTAVINDGVYMNATDGSARGTDLIYVSGTGCVEINGGTFEAASPEWTLNCRDADYRAGTAKIVVKGGRFKGFDPANNRTEGIGTNYVAEGYKSVLEGEYYVVKPI